MQFVVQHVMMLGHAIGDANRCNVRVDVILPKTRRAKMCDGMCTACGEDGAMLAYLRAAESARLAIAGLSQL